MSLVLLRVVLAGLFIATVAGKVRIPADPSPDINITVVVVKALNKQGLSARADTANGRSVLPDAVQLRPPGCDEMVEVLPININLQEAPVFDAVVRPDYVRQFAYLDRIWLSQDRLGMRLTWLKHKALSFFRLGRFETSTTGLLITSPPGCTISQTIDWSLVWDRRMIAAARSPQ